MHTLQHLLGFNEILDIKIRIVRFSCNTLSLCCTLLLCCIPYLAIEANIYIIVFIYISVWGGGGETLTGRREIPVSPPGLDCSCIIWWHSLLQICFIEMFGISILKEGNVAHCSELLKNTHLLTAN